jgi:hypothetical protein
MLNSDVYWITCETDVTCDWLCWITTILACMLVDLKSLVISLDYQSYMGSSARIWSLRWLFLYLCSYNLDSSVTLIDTDGTSTTRQPCRLNHQRHNPCHVRSPFKHHHHHGILMTHKQIQEKQGITYFSWTIKPPFDFYRSVGITKH